MRLANKILFRKDTKKNNQHEPLAIKAHKNNTIRKKKQGKMSKNEKKTKFKKEECEENRF
jgi:hypothetical protein